MADRFTIFDVILKRRRRGWRWCVVTTEGAVVMRGREASRAAARYQAARALFLLLLCAGRRPAPTAGVPASSRENLNGRDVYSLRPE